MDGFFGFLVLGGCVLAIRAFWKGMEYAEKQDEKADALKHYRRHTRKHSRSYRIRDYEEDED